MLCVMAVLWPVWHETLHKLENYKEGENFTVDSIIMHASVVHKFHFA